MIAKEVVYDKETRDWAFYLGGELAGFARTRAEAQAELDRLALELLSVNRYGVADPDLRPESRHAA